MQKQNLAEIIRAASKNELSIFVLMLLILPSIAASFFQTAPIVYRLIVWILMFIGVFFFGFAIFRNKLNKKNESEKLEEPSIKEITTEKEEPKESKKTNTPKKDVSKKVKNYLEWLEENYSSMDTERLQGRGQAIPLSLPEIFIPLYANDPESHKTKKAMEEKQGAVDIEELIAKNDYLVIEGHPGSGKTTLLKHLAYSLAVKSEDNPNIKDIKNFFPVLIFLKDLNLTFRRDTESNRPRANKVGSQMDEKQKKEGKLYYS